MDPVWFLEAFAEVRAGNVHGDVALLVHIGAEISDIGKRHGVIEVRFFALHEVAPDFLKDVWCGRFGISHWCRKDDGEKQCAGNDMAYFFHFSWPESLSGGRPLFLDW